MAYTGFEAKSGFQKNEYFQYDILMLSMKKVVGAAVLVVALLGFGAFGSAEAHPGRTDGSGGHTCRTNCESWGLGYGEYHYHGGGGSSNSSAGSDAAPVQEAVTLPTNTPVPLRLPTRIPTRVPTKIPTPTATVALSPTAIPTPTSEPTKKVNPVKSSVNPQQPQGFFDWLLSVLGLR
jgi:hypothetical protein